MLQLNPCSALSTSSCGADARVCDGNKTLSKKSPSLRIQNSDLITSTFDKGNTCVGVDKSHSFWPQW